MIEEDGLGEPSVDNFLSFSSSFAIIKIVMPSTKIINVQKEDSFEEVLAVMNNTSAEEIIFIFPKGTIFAKSEEYLNQIAEEAANGAKKISVMSSDPIICKLAANNDFEVMAAPASKSKTVTKKAQELEEPEENEENEENENVFTDDPVSPQVELTTYNNRKTMRDIVHNYPEKTLPLKNNDREFKVDISRASEAPELPENDPPNIAKIWSSYNRIGSTVKKIKHSRAKVIGMISIGVIILIGIYLYSTLAHATITVNPVKKAENFSLKLIASSDITEIDYKANKIPGQVLSSQVEELGDFQVSGYKNVIQKSSGKITVFNKSFLEQRLVATTRFESSGGLIFRIPASIIVPPAKKINGNVIPGQIETVVNADRAGKEFNINPDKFTIPGFKGSEKFNDFYAESKTAMAGGFIGPAKVVTESDMNKAKEELIKKAGDKVAKTLRSQSGELKILDNITINNEDIQFNAKVGEAVETLSGKLNSKASSMAFRESDVVGLVSKYLNENGSLSLIPNKYTLDYSNSELNLGSKILTINLKVDGTVTPILDKEKIAKDVLGMSEDAIRAYFKDPRIESVKIILSPFWVRKVPKNQSKIELRINVD